MTGRTIAGTYTAGISLTDPGDNPVTVLSGGIIDTGSGVALQGSSGTYWTIGNAGMVEATETTAGDIGVLLAGGGAVTNLTGGTIGGYDFGVSITGTGSVINDGHIGASKTVKPGYSYNSTTGVFTPLNAGVALGGGGISNAASAVISGYFQGVALGGNGSVVNAGTVQGGYGIVLTDGGTVSNASSGTVTSAGYGVLALGTNTAALDNQGVINSKDAVGVDLFRGGSLNNAGAALITGAMSGVVLGASTLGTVTNAGSIIGDQRVGVALYGGGSATNAAAGTIGGGYFGLRAANTASSVSVVNFGSLFSVQSYTGSPGFDAAGVNLVGGGTVSNGLTGRIQSTWKGVEIGNPSASAPGTVLNQGFIYASNSNGSTGAGVWINGPAMISNAASGTIAGGPFAIVVYNATTLVNYGRIAAVQYGTHTAFALDVVNPGFAESVAVAPGATFVGVVSGGNSIGSSVVSTLEFRSGNQIGSLSGIGSHYVEFGHISIDSGASWQLTGSNTLVAGGTLTNSGTLTLSNAILGDAGVLENDGVIAIDPSLLQVTNLTGNGALTLGAGSTIDSQGTIAAGETITFASTAAPLLQLEAQHGGLGRRLRARRYDRSCRCRSGIGAICGRGAQLLRRWQCGRVFAWACLQGIAAAAQQRWQGRHSDHCRCPVFLRRHTHRHSGWRYSGRAPSGWRFGTCRASTQRIGGRSMDGTPHGQLRAASGPAEGLAGEDRGGRVRCWPTISRCSAIARSCGVCR
jgi:hypothetical protein